MAADGRGGLGVGGRGEEMKAGVGTWGIKTKFTKSLIPTENFIFSNCLHKTILP